MGIFNKFTFYTHSMVTVGQLHLGIKAKVYIQCDVKCDRWASWYTSGKAPAVRPLLPSLITMLIKQLSFPF